MNPNHQPSEQNLNLLIEKGVDTIVEISNGNEPLLEVLFAIGVFGVPVATVFASHLFATKVYPNAKSLWDIVAHGDLGSPFKGGTPDEVLVIDEKSQNAYRVGENNRKHHEIHMIADKKLYAAYRAKEALVHTAYALAFIVSIPAYYKIADSVAAYYQ